MGRDDVAELARVARARASARPSHLRARHIDESYVAYLLQLLQQHYASVGEPSLLETMSDLRKSASKVLLTVLEGLDMVKRDIARHEDGLQKSILARILKLASCKTIDILDVSAAL